MSAEAEVEMEGDDPYSWLHGPQGATDQPAPTGGPVSYGPGSTPTAAGSSSSSTNPAVLPGGTERRPGQKRRTGEDDGDNAHTSWRVDSLQGKPPRQTLFHCRVCGVHCASKNLLFKHIRKERHTCASWDSVEDSWADIADAEDGAGGQSQRTPGGKKPLSGSVAVIPASKIADVKEPSPGFRRMLLVESAHEDSEDDSGFEFDRLPDGSLKTKVDTLDSDRGESKLRGKLEVMSGAYSKGCRHGGCSDAGCESRADVLDPEGSECKGGCRGDLRGGPGVARPTEASGVGGGGIGFSPLRPLHYQWYCCHRRNYGAGEM